MTMNLREKAKRFATQMHAGQFRRDGVTPYITHPASVAAMLMHESDEVVATAWLHDVVEDTRCTFSALQALGFAQVVKHVRLLTKVNGIPYEQYIEAIAECTSSSVPMKVKIADIAHNLSCDPTKRQKERYLWALSRLLAK